ncbi:peptidyl-prolyl cis-trans isomerase E [Spatholobus suberectus]|nr:peptidyl-prolyl cis-trans isomerase E [Spatholobus suberectus]
MLRWDKETHKKDKQEGIEKEATLMEKTTRDIVEMVAKSVEQVVSSLTSFHLSIGGSQGPNEVHTDIIYGNEVCEESNNDLKAKSKEEKDNRRVWADADTWFERQQQEEEMRRIEAENRAAMQAAEDLHRKQVAQEREGEKEEEIEIKDDPMAKAEAEVLQHNIQ